MLLLKAALISASLASVASASPVTYVDKSYKSGLTKRWEDGVDCTSDIVASAGTADLFFVIDSTGATVNCADINNDASDANGYACYKSIADDSELGIHVKCPGDPQPGRNPDGTVAGTIGDGLIDTFCDSGATLPGAAGEFATTVGCFLYGYLEGQGDPVAEAESGAQGACDTIFAGACTWFLDISSEISEAEALAPSCDDDPDSIACTFGGPSK